MASPISANRAELLAIATSVATEKMIDKSIVIEAMEEAIQKSARSRYGAENDIRAKLDPRTGDHVSHYPVTVENFNEIVRDVMFSDIAPSEDDAGNVIYHIVLKNS